MKFFAGIAGVFFAVLVCAGEPVVRIADTVGETALRTAVIRMALSGDPIACTQERVSPEKALAGLRNGTYDMVLMRRSAVPDDLKARCRNYAAEAAMISVNSKNARNDMTSRELAEVFSGWRRSWVTLNGLDFQIHLMRMKMDSFPVQIFREKIMGKRAFAPAFEREDGMELLHLAVVNENALVLTNRPDAELSTSLKVLSVDGIYPSLENVKNGRYPLSEFRTVILNTKPSGKVQKLLTFLFSAEMGKILADHGLIEL